MQGHTVVRPHDGSADFHLGLIEPSPVDRPELHGHIVTMDGRIVVPVLRPTGEVSYGRNHISSHHQEESHGHPGV